MKEKLVFYLQLLLQPPGFYLVLCCAFLEGSDFLDKNAGVWGNNLWKVCNNHGTRAAVSLEVMAVAGPGKLLKFCLCYPLLESRMWNFSCCLLSQLFALVKGLQGVDKKFI